MLAGVGDERADSSKTLRPLRLVSRDRLLPCACPLIRRLERPSGGRLEHLTDVQAEQRKLGMSSQRGDSPVKTSRPVRSNQSSIIVAILARRSKAP
jgi:hypothetical protein